MKAKKNLLTVTLLIILGSSLIIGHLLYLPPLFNGRGYNIPGRIYDSVAYVYYTIRKDWLEAGGQDLPARRAAARAAWYRPSRMERLLGIEPDRLFQLGREYAARGLKNKAVRLFKKAFPAALPDEEKSLEIISYLAILGDWPGTARAAREFLAAYHGSAEGEYWRGRALLELNQSTRAATHLRRAFQLRPTLSDALFQLGRLEERAVKKKVARSLYERVVARAPGHLGAWQGLVRLYREEGEEDKLEEARARAAALTPPIRLEKKYGNSFIFSGYRLPERAAPTGGRLELEVYLTGWRPRALSLSPEVILTKPGRPDRYPLPDEAIKLPGPGEVVTERLCWKIPAVIYPGTVNWGLSFSKPDPPAGREEAAGVRDLLSLPPFRLKPAWMPAAERGRLVRERFGSRAISLAKSTFLGPGDELKLSFDEAKTAVGVGLVSYLHRGVSLPQGATVGRLFVETEGRETQSYSIVAGRDTADVWWEYAEPWRRKHQPAPVFRSWPVKSRRKGFQGHEYYAVLRFPRLLPVKGLKFRNSSDKSGWYISDIVLIP